MNKTNPVKELRKLAWVERAFPDAGPLAPQVERMVRYTVNTESAKALNQRIKELESEDGHYVFE